MNILERIVEAKKVEVADRIRRKNIRSLKAAELFNRECLSLQESLIFSDTGIIAEYKTKSPSKGILNTQSEITSVTSGYTSNGASGLSVLTDRFFFGGSLDDLVKARVNPIPILRKDFIINEYQIYESKAFGADAILLIAACLTINETKHLSKIAKDLGLEVLLEIHDSTELEHIIDGIDIVGVNNRDLKTFNVDIKRSVELADMIPSKKIKISESGINTAENVHLLKAYGYNGFLIGEKFMKEADPVMTFVHFMDQLKQYES